MPKLFQIKTEEGRPIAGIFTPIKTREMAERIRLQWEHNYPNQKFIITETDNA